MKPIAFAKSVYAYARLARDPGELNRVFEMRDAATDSVLAQANVTRLREMHDVDLILKRKVRLGRISFAELDRFPPGSLGAHYAQFLRSNNLSPDALPNRSAHTDNDYVNAHLFETHDLWHVLMGFGADVPGEAGMQAVYAAQLPLAAFQAALVSALLLNAALDPLSGKSRPIFDAVARGYVLGTKAKMLFGLDWRSLLPLPLEQVRRDLRVEIEAPTSIAA